MRTGHTQRQRWFLDQLRRKAPVEDHEHSVQEESQQALAMDLTQLSRQRHHVVKPCRDRT